jgi:Fic family protein
MVNLISSISEELTRIEFNQKEIITPYLRKKNRIKTLAGTLAIEGNFMGEERITAILEGKPVLGTALELAEVEGAINCYKELEKYQFDDIDSILKSHQILMHGILKRPGTYRTVNVGVGNHVAPQNHLVPGLMADLFEWLKHSDEHPLIKSSVFHFEFEFIHPFSDGNGRIGRLWQTVILYNWKKVFNALPIESIVKECQQEYYDALDISSKTGKGTYFVEFMLGVILKTVVEQVQKQKADRVGNGVGNRVGNESDNVLSENQKNILMLIEQNSKISAQKLSDQVKISKRKIEENLAKLKEMGFLKRMGGTRGRWEIQ